MSTRAKFSSLSDRFASRAKTSCFSSENHPKAEHLLGPYFLIERDIKPLTEVSPESLTLTYRDEIVSLARKILPGRVGVSANGFAGHFLPDERK